MLHSGLGKGAHEKKSLHTRADHQQLREVRDSAKPGLTVIEAGKKIGVTQHRLIIAGVKIMVVCK